MKPRKTNLKKAVLAQSKKLRPITPIQINWAFRNCVEHYAHRLPKGRTTCMDCGHSWVMTEQTEHCTCPECGASLKVCLHLSAQGKTKAVFHNPYHKRRIPSATNVLACRGYGERG